MAFGDAEDFIDRLHPISLQWLFVKKAKQGAMKGSVKPLGSTEERIGALGVGIG